jgi:hypothetical protein
MIAPLTTLRMLTSVRPFKYSLIVPFSIHSDASAGMPSTVTTPINVRTFSLVRCLVNRLCVIHDQVLYSGIVVARTFKLQAAKWTFLVLEFTRLLYSPACLSPLLDKDQAVRPF